PPTSLLFPYTTLFRSRLARFDGGKERLHLLQEVALQHASFGSGGVHVVFKDVPTGKNQIAQLGQRDEILYCRRIIVRALPKPDRDRKSTRLNSSHSQI